MVVALTVTPALSLLLLRGVPIERRKSPLVTWLQRAYTAALSRIIIRPVAVYAVFAAANVERHALGFQVFDCGQHRIFIERHHRIAVRFLVARID